ncbi:TonB-dependent receptor domain-containing protein [Methylophaga sp.]|uniref:TonB-dependent receptor n=1 Tax=Methylophaga sp. TaxID=2024840 RepID=UPI003A8F3FF5
MPLRRFLRLPTLFITLNMCAATGLFVGVSQHVYAQDSNTDVQSFSLSAGSLDQVLRQFGLNAGIALYVDSSLVNHQHSNGLVGDYTAHQGLQTLLAGTGLTAVQQPDGSYRIEPVPTLSLSEDESSVDLGKIDIVGDTMLFTQDTIGYNDVYDRNTSTSYIGKTEIERYKGTTPSDLLQGVPGVFSGEARNSGALDVNIRGIQGTGRVPVSIDGTEQALTVWRGYNGATNRNYIDPSLIGNIQIYKGAGVVRDVNTSTGGALVASTLSPDDIIRPGEDFGAELKIEVSSNSVSERIPHLHTGEDVRDSAAYPNNYGMDDRTLDLNPRSGGGGYNVFSGDDNAYRLAVAKKTDVVDVIAAYAYRERGNYYAGKNNSGYYDNSEAEISKDYVATMARSWKPGGEVLNTSSRMESWLFKSTLHLSEDQDLEFGFRDSRTVYGEIMPSRIDRFQRGAVQWPLSDVDAKAYNLKYTFKPEDNPWVDLHANVWRTNTISNTYTRGGFPNYANYNSNEGTGNPIIENNAVTHAKNTRNGVNVSNKMNITDTLDLTIGGKFEHEKQRSDDKELEYAGAMYPREGRRQQWEFDFDAAWRPVDFLEFNGGMRYTSFWAFDDYLHAHEGEITTQQLQRYDVKYSVEKAYTSAEQQAWVNSQLSDYQFLLSIGAITQNLYDAIEADTLANVPTSYSEQHTVAWTPDEDGNYNRADNACLNGSLDDQNVTKCSVTKVKTTVDAKSERKKDHGWVPHFGTTIHFNDYNRVYFRYAEDLRYPSLFESTVGFSASISQYEIEPEHNYMWELAYVSDLTNWLPKAEYADFKVTYYHSLTRDVIERDNNLQFNNIDKQTIRGLELSGRYDTGRFFTDFGVNYTLENEVCDEDTAARLSDNSMSLAKSDPIPKCMKYGFPSSYLLTQATPELSINWSIGGRFFDRKLEVGSRVTYYKEYENKDLDWYTSHDYDPSNPGAGSYVNSTNLPFSWGETTLIDAYARYNINEQLLVELVGTNLTDQYFIDPATRSLMAAPGRTFKLSLTAKF